MAAIAGWPKFRQHSPSIVKVKKSCVVYQIGLSSNTATPLALFGGSLRIELTC